MTAPTSERVEEWARQAGALPTDYYYGVQWLERFAALAFAAGQSGQASGSGAELVREVEESAQTARELRAPKETIVACFEAERMTKPWSEWWPRIRAALISGDAAREDAERLQVEIAWQRFCWKNVRMLAARHRKEEWAQHMLRFCDEAGVKASPLRDAEIDRARGGGDA